MTQLTGSISGTVIDSNSNDSIKGVKVKLGEYIKSTDSKGNFILKVTYESGSLPSILFSKKDYQSLEYVPFNGDGTLKNNLILKLEPTPSALAKDKTNTFSFSQNQINDLKIGRAHV